MLTETDGEYILSCHTMDCINISYDEYNNLATGGTIDTEVGALEWGEEWEPEGIILRSVNTKEEYIIGSITGPDDQEILRDPYTEYIDQNGDVVYFPMFCVTGEKEYCISNNVVVNFFDYNTYKYAATDFYDYLNNGNATMGSPMWGYTFYVTVVDGKITGLNEMIGSVDEEGDEGE